MKQRIFVKYLCNTYYAGENYIEYKAEQITFERFLTLCNYATENGLVIIQHGNATEMMVYIATIHFTYENGNLKTDYQDAILDDVLCNLGI